MKTQGSKKQKQILLFAAVCPRGQWELDSIREWAEKHGYNIIAQFCCYASEGNLRRSKFDNFLWTAEFCKAGLDYLLINSVFELGRDFITCQKNLQKLKDLKIQIVFSRNNFHLAFRKGNPTKILQYLEYKLNSIISMSKEDRDWLRRQSIDDFSFPWDGWGLPEIIPGPESKIFYPFPSQRHLRVS